jgi:hypothetical protein
MSQAVEDGAQSLKSRTVSIKNEYPDLNPIKNRPD